MSSRLIKATAPELLRLNQKDEEYSYSLFAQLVDGIELFAPSLISYRWMSSNQSSLRILSTCAYYLLTTLSNRKTLGEEFVNVAQFNESDFDGWGKPTRFRRRSLFFILSIILPPLLRKFIKQRFDQRRSLALADSTSHLDMFSSIMRCLPDFDGFLEKLIKMHICSFFLDGMFVQIGKRLSNIQYVFQQQPQKHSLTYSKVGKILAIQLVIEGILLTKKVYYDIKQSRNILANNNLRNNLEASSLTSKQHKQQEEDEEIPSELQCNLCYDRRTNTACTPCGHLFCWDCIIKSTQIKPECPNCRTHCKPQKIIALANFS